MSVQWFPPAPPPTPIAAAPAIPFTCNQIDWMQLVLTLAIAWSIAAPIGLLVWLS